MKFALVDEIHEVDKRAIEELHIPEIVLMENAGSAVYRAIRNFCGEIDGGNACVVIGSGNNGGDGLVVARYLANAGMKVSVFVMSKISKMTESTKAELAIVRAMGIEVREPESEQSWNRLQVALRFANLIVDGMLGTGLKSDTLKPNVKRAIEMINGSGKVIVSIDIPSGVLADSGMICENAIRANLTVTFAMPKFAQFICPAMECVGKLVVDEIGIPPELFQNVRQTIIDRKLVKSLMKPRSRDAHKGTCGKILVIAGSRGMTGAACLASQAAVRIGAGLVTLAIPKSLNNIMEEKLTEVMTIPVSESLDGKIFIHGILGGETALNQLLELQEKFDAILIGCGLGRRAETLEFVRKFTAQIDKPLILDADAIYAFKDHKEDLKNLKRPPILTPHLGEMATLLDSPIPVLKNSLISKCRDAAKIFNANFLVKSEASILVTPAGEIFLSNLGNSGMATGGVGDVLAGTIAGLMNQVEDPIHAAICGMYFHGRAGDLAFEKNGNGLIASDLIDFLPQALKDF